MAKSLECHRAYSMCPLGRNCRTWSTLWGLFRKVSSPSYGITGRYQWMRNTRSYRRLSQLLTLRSHSKRPRLGYLKMTSFEYLGASPRHKHLPEIERPSGPLVSEMWRDLPNSSLTFLCIMPRRWVITARTDQEGSTVSKREHSCYRFAFVISSE